LARVVLTLVRVRSRLTSLTFALASACATSTEIHVRDLDPVYAGGACDRPSSDSIVTPHALSEMHLGNGVLHIPCYRGRKARSVGFLLVPMNDVDAIVEHARPSTTVAAVAMAFAAAAGIVGGALALPTGGEVPGRSPRSIEASAIFLTAGVALAGFAAVGLIGPEDARLVYP
jgi:hypothetical protein